MAAGAWVLTGLLSGCSALGFSGSSTDSGNRPEPSAGPGWLIYVPGNPTPSPATPGWPPTTVAATPALTPPVMVRTSRTPGTIPDPCYGRLYEGKYDLLGVVPGSGSATVSWTNAGDDSVASYKVAAVPQDLVAGTQPALNWVTVAPGAACAPMSATITGLTSGGRYVFWLVALLSKEPREIQIGRSLGVRIP